MTTTTITNITSPFFRHNELVCYYKVKGIICWHKDKLLDIKNIKLSDLTGVHF
ncbi:MAG: hypothetical protein ACP5T7_05600 [bacterium]